MRTCWQEEYVLGVLILEGERESRPLVCGVFVVCLLRRREAPARVLLSPQRPWGGRDMVVVPSFCCCALLCRVVAYAGISSLHVVLAV